MCYICQLSTGIARFASDRQAQWPWRQECQFQRSSTFIDRLFPSFCLRGLRSAFAFVCMHHPALRCTSICASRASQLHHLLRLRAPLRATECCLLERSRCRSLKQSPSTLDCWTSLSVGLRDYRDRIVDGDHIVILQHDKETKSLLMTRAYLRGRASRDAACTPSHFSWAVPSCTPAALPLRILPRR